MDFSVSFIGAQQLLIFLDTRWGSELSLLSSEDAA